MTEKKLNFCTVFDSGFLVRGLALYRSLEEHCPNFHLYVIAFDDVCHTLLTRLNLPNLTSIPLAEFEDPELLRIKPTRSEREYCWTCSSSSILYMIKTYNLDMCAYIDADMLFFGDPNEITDEMKEKSILLTEHRLPETGTKIERNGRYCVQFMPFKNTADGLKALSWWRERCIEWCYDRLEDGKLGDQMYLNDWTTRFPGVHVMEHIGGGVAPWNMFRYAVSRENSALYLTEKKTGKKARLIFYHFQSTKIFNLFDRIQAFYYPYDVELYKSAREIYATYERYLLYALSLVRTIEPTFGRGFHNPKLYASIIRRKLLKDGEKATKKIIKNLLGR